MPQTVQFVPTTGPLQMLSDHSRPFRAPIHPSFQGANHLLQEAFLCHPKVSIPPYLAPYIAFLKQYITHTQQYIKYIYT